MGKYDVWLLGGIPLRACIHVGMGRCQDGGSRSIYTRRLVNSKMDSYPAAGMNYCWYQ